MGLLFRTLGVHGECVEDGARRRPLVIVWLLLLCVSVGTADGFPAGHDDRNLSASEVSRAVVFLTRFGYLPPTDEKTGNLLSEAEFRSAIADMQRFGGLPSTGRMDPLTAALMDARRCGVPDYVATLEDRKTRVRRYAIQGQKWPGTHLTWSVRSDDGPASDLRMVRAQLRRAFGVWSDASALSFQEVAPPRDPHRPPHGKRGKSSADIVVSFLKGPHGDGYPFDGEGSVLAHAFFPGEGIGGDAHFDAEERWLPNQPQEEDDGVNLFAVAAHEIGHSLGLSHSSTPGSLMFPYYQLIGDGQGFRLPRDDAEGIRHLYGAKNPESESTPLPELPSSTTPVATTTTDVSPETSTAVVTSGETTTTSTTTPDPRGKKRKKLPPSESPDAAPPDICQSSIDAISLIRREIFVFKGNYFWRLHTNRTLRPGYPVSIDRFWYDLPPDIARIDALYERPTDTKIVFFSGKRYWLFSANRVEPGYPRPLTELGLPEDLDRVDAALVWGHNGKTYLFGGERYWKLDEEEGRVELDYPRSVAAWRGVPAHVDAAFQWTDGNTYFFKDNQFWKFVDVKMRVEKRPPSEIGGFWFQCPSKTMGGATAPTTVDPPPGGRPDSAANDSGEPRVAPYLYVLFLIHIFCTLSRISRYLGGE